MHQKQLSCPIKKLCKEALFPHKQWSHLHPKGTNVNKIFTKTMKTISRKMVVMCQCINVNVNSLLASLDAWILALLDHLSQLTYGYTLHFELKKMKVVKLEKNEWESKL